MNAFRVHYEGRVQGVGFRWTARSLANAFEVAGTVRNLPDGRVEMVVAGEEAEAFLEAVRTSSLAGHISAERCEETELHETPRGFRIVP